MANLNKVFLMGNLTRDPEMRYIPSGQPVVTFTVAVNRNYTLQSGEKKEETAFLRVVVWGKRAETCNEYLSKGSPVLVEGRLTTRSWETPEGQKRSTVEVVADNVQFLGRARESAAPREEGTVPFSEGSPSQKRGLSPFPEPGTEEQGPEPHPAGGSNEEVPF